ncbi:MAG: hypothetical protein WC627_01310 [Legionella sp.]|jgi:hypothetical protein
MPDSLKKTIRAKLDETAELIDLSMPAHDYASVQDKVLQIELDKELAELEALLDKSDHFDRAFKRRCRLRQNNHEYSIGFEKVATTYCNQLYWDLAELIFQPKTMGEMLRIIMPKLSSYVQISLPSYLPYPNMNQRQQYTYFKSFDPVYNYLDLNNLNYPPKFETLDYFVIGENVLMDVRDIKPFSLLTHAKLKNSLTSDHADLASKLYEHNYSLKKLANDIDTYNVKGMTPRTAIDNLIQRLFLGSTKVTGQLHTTKTAAHSVYNFFAYLEYLPLSTQIELKALRNSKYRSLQGILTNLINGECVHVASMDLTDFLNFNVNERVLNLPPKMSPQQLKTLENTYKFKLGTQHSAIDVCYDYENLIPLPQQLVKQVIEGIRPDTCEELYDLLSEFAPEFYDMLFAHIILDDEEYMNQLSNIIQSDIFTYEQKQALSKALFKYRIRFIFPQNIYKWACLTNDAVFIKTAEEQLKQDLEVYPIDERKSFIENNHYLIHLAPFSLFTTILQYYDDSEQLAAIKKCERNGATLINLAAKNSNNLKLIFNLYPDSERLHLAKNPNLLKEACKNAQSLHFLLSLFAIKNRFKLLKIRVENDTIMHLAAQTPETLQTVLNLIPPEQRVTALLLINAEDHTVLERTAQNAECFLIALSYFPKNKQKYKQFRRKDKYNRTILYALEELTSIKTILDVYSPELKLLAMTEKDSENKSVLHSHIENPDCLRFILDLLPTEQRILAMDQLNEQKECFLHQAIQQPESFKVILQAYPLNKRFNVLKRYNNYGETIIGSFINTADDLIDILEYLPNNDKFFAIISYASIEINLFEGLFNNASHTEYLLNTAPTALKDATLLHDTLRNIHKSYTKIYKLMRISAELRDTDMVLAHEMLVFAKKLNNSLLTLYQLAIKESLDYNTIRCFQTEIDTLAQSKDKKLRALGFESELQETIGYYTALLVCMSFIVFGLTKSLDFVANLSEGRSTRTDMNPFIP